MPKFVTIEPFGETIEISAEESVLSGILRHGKFVRYGCKHGGCGTCRARLVEGNCRVDAQTSFALSDLERSEDIVLLCATYLEGDSATFDLSGLQTLTEAEFHAGQVIVEYEAVVERLIRRTRNIQSLRLVTPQAISFSAGQYIEIEVPGHQDEWRAYSMSSPPQVVEYVEVTVKILPAGRFSSQIGRQIRPGTRLRVRGPLGQFVVRLSHRPIVMVAGGSGMGPIFSMIRDLAARDNDRPVTFFYGARARRDLFFVDQLRDLAIGHDWLTFVPVLSAPDTHDAWTRDTGFVTEAMLRHIPSFRGYEGYLCGPPLMVDAALALLVQNGCKRRHIYFDRFVPSG